MVDSKNSKAPDFVNLWAWHIFRGKAEDADSNQLSRLEVRGETENYSG